MKFDFCKNKKRFISLINGTVGALEDMLTAEQSWKRKKVNENENKKKKQQRASSARLTGCRPAAAAPFSSWNCSEQVIVSQNLEYFYDSRPRPDRPVTAHEDAAHRAVSAARHMRRHKISQVTASFHPSANLHDRDRRRRVGRQPPNRRQPPDRDSGRCP